MENKKIWSALGILAVLLAAVFLTGCSPQESAEDQATALETALDEASELGREAGYAQGLLDAPTPETVYEDSQETLDKLAASELEAEASAEELETLEATLDGREDELEEWAKEDEVYGLCKAYVAEDDDEEVSDAVWKVLDNSSANVEDQDEDLLSYRWVKQEDLNVRDLDYDDDEEAEGEVSGEFKVKYREDGPDGDRHTAYFDAYCYVYDGEVEEFSLAE